MPKRQSKPSLITPDEVMGSSALQGFDSFLRFRAAAPVPAREPRELQPTTIRKPNLAPVPAPAPAPPQPAVGLSPIGGSTGAAAAASAVAVTVIRPPRKPRRAQRAEDGHSIGEQCLYQALWNSASPEGADTRLIRAGYGGMQSLCGLDKTNCKDHILSLIQKLAVEVVSGFDIRRNEGNTYRIFSAPAILQRRRAAGLEWVIRGRGVRLLTEKELAADERG